MSIDCSSMLQHIEDEHPLAIEEERKNYFATTSVDGLELSWWRGIFALPLQTLPFRFGLKLVAQTLVTSDNC